MRNRRYYAADETKHYCCYCGRWLVYPMPYNTEHLIPRSKGGNNSDYNKRDCCHECNTWRGSKELLIWQAQVSELLKRNKTYRFFNKQDLETMVENISYWIEYINANRDKLLRENKIPPKPGE